MTSFSHILQIVLHFLNVTELGNNSYDLLTFLKKILIVNYNKLL